jgi:hypothetical protein
MLDMHPGAELDVRCRRCIVDPEGVEVHFTGGQVHRLRAHGASDEEIAHLFALAATSGANGDLDATQLHILAFPNGPKARMFKARLIEMRLFVGMTRMEPPRQ